MLDVDLIGDSLTVFARHLCRAVKQQNKTNCSRNRIIQQLFDVPPQSGIGANFVLIF